MLKPTTEQVAEQRKLAYEMPLLMDRVMRAGLYQTGHAMHEAVRKLGWEMAEQQAALQRKE